MEEKKNTGGRFPDMRNRELKEQAVAFYQENKIPEVLEKMLNKMYLAKPNDLYGYMCNYFSSMSKDPVISSVCAHEGLDGNGGKSVEVELHCIVCGIDKVVSKASLPLDPFVENFPTTSSVSKGGAKRSPKASTTSQISPMATRKMSNEYSNFTGKKIDPLETVRKHINEALTGLSVSRLSEVDQILKDVMDSATTNKIALHPSSVLAVSCAVAIAAAQLASHPLFLYLTSSHFHADPTDNFRSSPVSSRVDIILEPKALKNPGEIGTGVGSTLMPKQLFPIPKSGGSSQPPSPRSRKYPIPIPMVAVLGKGTGKLKIREFCLSPLPGTPLPHQIRMMEKIYAELGKLLSIKQGFSVCCTQPNAPYCPSIDKPEQALEWIKEAATSAGHQCDVDAGIFIDVGADMLYDKDKEKYELVAGQWKSTEDVINIYSDLLQATNGLLGFIDPLHPKDFKGWKKLNDKLGSKCLFVADYALEKGLPLALNVKKPEKREKMSLLTHTSIEGTAADEVEEIEEKGTSAVAEEKLEMEEKGTSAEAEEKLDGLSCAALTLSCTLSATIEKADHLKDFSQYVMMRVPPTLTANTVIVDLAVASQCRFIRIGAPTGISTLLLNRMLQIREELVLRKLNEPAKAHLLASKFEQ